MPECGVWAAAPLPRPRTVVLGVSSVAGSWTQAQDEGPNYLSYVPRRARPQRPGGVTSSTECGIGEANVIAGTIGA
jgi:hypothetical protein